MVPEQDPVTPDAGGQEPVGNMSFEQFVARRTQALATEPEEESQQEADPEEIPEDELPADEVENESEEIAEEEAEGEEETEDEEAQEFDIESLSPEQIQQIAKKGKSRLLQRIGELTAKNKSLEESLNTNRADAKPLPKPIADNPFASYQTIEALDAKREELERVAEWTDQLLEDHEDYGPEDLIQMDGKEFTKKEIRLANRNSRNALLKLIPAQHAEIVRVGQRKEQELAFDAAIPEQIPELADEASDMSKSWQAMLADPLTEQIRQRVPEIAPQLRYLLAHAARSMSLTYKPQPRSTAPGVKPKPKVAGNPVPVAAARSGPPGKAKAGEAYQKFEQTGGVDDWIAARAARFQS